MDRIRCSLCSTPFKVSPEDPDAAVDEAVKHVAKIHGRDPLLGERGLLSIERIPDHENRTEPDALPDGTLALPCGSLWSVADREEWRANHLPGCGICTDNFGPSDHENGSER